MKHEQEPFKEISLPTEVDLGVGVAVVKNHGEEFSGWLQRGFLVHLIIDSITEYKKEQKNSEGLFHCTI